MSSSTLRGVIVIVIASVGAFFLGRWQGHREKEWEKEREQERRRRAEAARPPVLTPPPPPPPPRLYLYIMRGLPGSGKSYIAQQPRVLHEQVRKYGPPLENYWTKEEDEEYERKNEPGSGVNGSSSYFVCSADNYFINEKGIYKYDVRNIGRAHNYCQTVCIEQLAAKTPEIVVDNTASTKWEYELYRKLGTAFGYKVLVLEVECKDEKTLSVFQKRNSHGVGREGVENMWKRWEKDPTSIMISPWLGES